MKIIDLLNRVAQEKNVPKKIKYCGVIYELQTQSLDYVDDEFNYLFDDVLRWDYLFQHLNDEVEILDNETNEIEEIEIIKNDDNKRLLKNNTTTYTIRVVDEIIINKMNELVKAVNKIQKEQVLTKSLNIISDCAKETNCMSD